MFTPHSELVVSSQHLERQESIEFIEESYENVLINKKKISLYDYYKHLNHEQKWRYLTHFVKLDYDIKSAFGHSALRIFSQFPISEAIKEFTLEQQCILASIHIERSGIHVLKRYNLDDKDTQKLKDEAKTKLQEYLPFFSMTTIEELYRTNNHQQLKYELYKRFSRRFNHHVYFLPLERGERDILYHHEKFCKTFAELRKVVLKVIDEQQKGLLQNGWFELPYQSPTRPKYWNAEKIKPEDNIQISHGGGFFHIIEFLQGHSLGYRLENQDGRGIQVSTMSHERDKLYALRACNNYIDYPARISATIEAQYLDAAPNLYEAGLRAEYIDKLKEIVVTRLDTQITYYIGTTADLKTMDLDSLIFKPQTAVHTPISPDTIVDHETEKTDILLKSNPELHKENMEVLPEGSSATKDLKASVIELANSKSLAVQEQNSNTDINFRIPQLEFAKTSVSFFSRAQTVFGGCLIVIGFSLAVLGIVNDLTPFGVVAGVIAFLLGLYLSEPVIVGSLKNIFAAR